MKLVNILTAALSLLLLSSGVAADGKNTTTYAAGMTGVMCDGCKAHIREAFSKLEGIDAKSITIEAGEKQGTRKVTFKSASAKLKKEDAVKSLGEQATKYVVVTFEPVKKK